MKSHIQELKRLGACQEAVTWADNHPDMAAVWANCERGDWLLWLLGKLSGEPESAERKRLVFVCAQVAREMLPIFEKRYPNDKRVRECLEACGAYSRGEITLAELRDNRAAYTGAASVAAYAASAAAYAASAASAASAAAYAAYAAAYAMRKRSAEIVRQHYPQFPGFSK